MADLQASVSALETCSHEPYSRELEKIIADILIRLSDIARIARISQEQVLTDRIEDLIDRYEKILQIPPGIEKCPKIAKKSHLSA